MPATTKKQFEVFSKEVRKWAEYFGLKCWEIYTLQAEPEEAGSCVSWAYVDKLARNATICLATEWPDSTPLTDYELRRAAFHEIAEVMLGPLQCLAGSRTVTAEEIESECHIIIQRLTNTVWEDSQRRGK